MHMSVGKYLSKKTNLLLKTLVSGGLVTVLFVLVDWDAFLKAIIAADILLIALGGLLVFSGTALSVSRWLPVLHYYGVPLKWSTGFKLYIEGSFFSTFLPTSFGGDAYKFLVLSKRVPEKKSEIAASMIIERGSGFVFLIIFNLLLSPLFLKTIEFSTPLLIMELGILSIFILSILMFAFKTKVESLLDQIFGDKSRFYSKFKVFVHSVTSIRSTQLALLTSFFSILFIVNITIGQLLYLNAFGASVNPLFVLWAVSIIYLGGIIPISLNSIGILEGLSVFLYSLAGVSFEIALAIAVVGRVLAILANSLGGLTYLLSSSIPTDSLFDK
jgi:glycosyltransferase 2 family protein